MTVKRLFVHQMAADRKAETAAYERLKDEMPWLWPGVYVMTSDTSTVIKVGRSKNPTRRVMELQVSNQDVLRVFWVVRVRGEGSKKLERTFHKLCEGTKHHIRGEWYSLKPEIAVRTLKAIAERLNLETSEDLRFGFKRDGL